MGDPQAGEDEIESWDHPHASSQTPLSWPAGPIRDRRLIPSSRSRGWPPSLPCVWKRCLIPVFPGAGRRDFNGAFVLNEFTVNMAPPGPPCTGCVAVEDAAPWRVFIAPARAVPTPGKTGSNAPSMANSQRTGTHGPRSTGDKRLSLNFGPNPDEVAASTLVVQLTSVGSVMGQAAWAAFGSP